MSGRRSWIAIVLTAAALHAVGIARSTLPAQDGLKFLRVARSFQTGPWADAVRGTDQHPLYPALIALVEPALAATAGGHGPDTWRVSAQLVAASAAVALLFPLHGLSRDLFGPRVADLAALGFVLLPMPMALGHDTLSDSLALFFSLLSLRLGLQTLAAGRWEPAVGCGLAAGAGYLARPEAVVVPLAVLATSGLRAVVRGGGPARSARPGLAPLAVAFLAVVGSYAVVKGEVSEKLSLRVGLSLRPSAPARRVVHWLPPGLDDPRWDFSPKQEPVGVPHPGLGGVARSLFLQWSDGLSGILAFFALWGFARDAHARRVVGDGGERPDPGNLARWLVATYAGLFALLLLRHELRTGYLSDRHALALVTLSLPWAAAGVYVCARGVAVRLPLTPRRAWLGGLVVLAAFAAPGVLVQLKPAHPSRWGHREAGRWLASHAATGDAVLDTRGWAAFVSGLSGYDYWHVRQALTDARLAYVVVGDDELTAPSRRAATLRAVLAYSARPVAGFAGREDGRGAGVRVYRYERPASWEGLRP